MKPFIAAVCAFILVFFFDACSDRREKKDSKNRADHTNTVDSNYSKGNFDSLMVVIEKAFPTGIDYGEEVLPSQAFKAIFDHSSIYLEDAIAFLSKENLSKLDASVCIFAMQNLLPDEYVKFCKVFIPLFEKKKIEEGILREAISPNFLQKRIIAENFTNPRVIELLNSIKNEKNLSTEFKDEIENILSGKYIHDLNN